MSQQNVNSASGAADQSSNPQGAALTAAPLSRLVTRDKRQIESPPSNGIGPYTDKPSERLQFVTYGNGQGAVIATPLPERQASPRAATVDWLGVSVVPPEGMALEWFFGELERVFGLPMTKPRPGGWMGYKQSAWLGDYGLVAWGGIHQRGTLHAEINGQGCAQVKDWIGVAAWGNALGATITRIDLAHDDYEGRLCNPGQIEAWYDTGGFNSGGCPPKLRHDGDYTECTDGQTLYIGTRGNKLLRCYEKGKQLKFPTSPWFRVELELKNKNRIIPWEAVELPGQYLAGAYPCLAFLAEAPSKIKTTQKATSMTLEVVERNASRLSGKAINVLMQENDENAELVIAKLRRDGIPKRLQPYQDGLKQNAKPDENT